MNLKDVFFDKINKSLTPLERLNFLREYLQVLTLSCLSEEGWFKRCAFMGGTCLSLCHQLERFSEDLDFVLIPGVKATPDQLDLILNTALKGLEKSGFKVRKNVFKTKKNVWKTFIAFEEVLSLLLLTKDKRETLQIKIEIDSNPPPSFDAEPGTAQTKSHLLIAPNLIKGSLSSLFGGKMHAILFRSFTKARDIYDLHWYLTNQVSLNIKIVEETQKTLGVDTEFLLKQDFISVLKQAIIKIDIPMAIKEMGSFVSRVDELPLIFNKEMLLLLVESIKFWRPMNEEEFFKYLMATPYLINQIKKPYTFKEISKQVNAHYFEISAYLSKRGVFLDVDLNDSHKGLLSFLRRYV